MSPSPSSTTKWWWVPRWETSANCFPKPTFDPDDKKDILRALEEARRLAAWGQGEVNYTYGMENMSIRKVGQAYAQTYKQAING